jgi:hypothetical protein
MTAQRVPVRVAANLTRGYVDQVNAIAHDAAQADNAGKWGIDGWIRLIHNLLDLQMRTCATAVDIALAGPRWWLEQPPTDPGPSDPVTVTAAAYPRTISIVEPLRRVGRTDVVIPGQAIHFVPDSLPAGATSFEIRLSDVRYVGASYTGKVRLRRSDRAGRDSSTVSFSVGL